MIFNKIKSKNGSFVLIIVFALVILFPILISGIIDLTNICRISKTLKVSLDTSVKSASSRIDWKQVPNGVLQIDIAKANSVYLDIFKDNYNVIKCDKIGEYYQCTSPARENVNRNYVAIYNNRHKGTFVKFPSIGVIPKIISDKDVQIDVDRPTVFAIGTTEYTVSPLFGGKTVKITRWASSELNVLPPEKQKSATYTP